MRFFRIIKTSLNLEGHIENQCTRLVVASEPENDSQEESYADKFCTIKDLCGGGGQGWWLGGLTVKDAWSGVVGVEELLRTIS